MQYYEIRKISEGNLGVFARCKIPIGSKIISEVPLLFATLWLEDGQPTSFESQLDQLYSQYYRLNFEDQEAVMSLCDCHVPPDETDKTLYGIFLTNRCRMGLYAATICPSVSRINHSCLPNCINHFDGHVEEVFALRDIEEGEEVKSAYFDIRLNRLERLEYIKDLYHFDCACIACSSNDVYSDVRRDRMAELDIAITSAVCQQDSSVAISLLFELLTLYDDEGFPEAYCKGPAFFAFFQMFKLSGDVEMANEYLKRAFKYYVFCEGESSVMSLKLKSYIENPDLCKIPEMPYTQQNTPLHKLYGTKYGR